MALVKQLNNTKKPVKILHAIHWPKSGIVTMVYNIISQMPKDKVESHVVFFCYDRDTLLDFDKICASTHWLNLSGSSLRGIFKFYRVLNQVSPDILHAHSFQPIIWGSLFSIGNNKQIATIHSPYPYFTERKVRSILKRRIQKLSLSVFSTKVVAVSGIVYQRLSNLGIPEKNLSMIENGVPLEIYSHSGKDSSSIKKELSICPKNILIMTLGRLSKEKGYDVLLRAFRTVYQKHNDVVLAIIGDGDEGKRLMVLAKELGIAERVRFLGFKKSPLDYLKAADIFVCSSLYEGFSLATLEAMLCKLPVVATRVGSIPDMIKHSISGLLVEPGDPKQLTGALLDLIYNKYDKKLMGEKALETVIKRYDIRNTVKAYYELYKCIVTE